MATVVKISILDIFSPLDLEWITGNVSPSQYKDLDGASCVGFMIRIVILTRADPHDDYLGPGSRILIRILKHADPHHG